MMWTRRLPLWGRRSISSAVRQEFLDAYLTDHIADSLPLLSSFVDTLQSGEFGAAVTPRPLEGITMLQLQHQMGQHIAQVRAMGKLGLEMTQTHCVDIPYTASAAVSRRLIEEGIPLRNIHKHRYRLRDSYLTYQHQRVSEVVTTLASQLTPDSRLLVLDDGAYVLEALAALAKTPDGPATLKHLLPRLCIVEQTMRGIIKVNLLPGLREICEQTTVVNVAECSTKKHVEPEFIGINAALFLGEVLRANKVFLEPDECVLITGYGAIGRAVAVACRHDMGCRVFVHDTDPVRREMATKDNFALWDFPSGRATRQFRAVVGCSGVRSFAPSAAWLNDLADSCMMISASSGNHELAFEEFAALHYAAPRQSDGLDVRAAQPELLEAEANLHVLVDFDVRYGKEPARSVRLRFVNGGFPITFSGRLNAVPSRLIQPTNTLMTAGAADAALRLRAGERGLRLLRTEFDTWIRREAERYVR